MGNPIRTMYHSGLSITITPFVRLATSLKYPSPTYTYSISLSHPQLSGQCSHFSWSPYTRLKSSRSSPEVRNVCDHVQIVYTSFLKILRTGLEKSNFFKIQMGTNGDFWGLNFLGTTGKTIDVIPQVPKSSH